MMKKLNSMLEIETKLSMSFHPQTDGQTERMNQKLEQYLRFFVDHRQKNWPEWLASAEFAINNKVHLTKMEKTTEFAERMRKVQEEAEVALVRT